MPAAQDSPTDAVVERPSNSPHGRLWIAVAAIAVAVVVAAAAFALMLPVHHAPAPMVQVLEPQGGLYSLPAGQLNGIAFEISSTSVVNGTFYTSYGITLYTMTPTQFESLTKTGVVGGYNWTSGRIANNTITQLNVVVPPGSWDLAFVNGNPLVGTLVAFYSDLTLAPQ